MDKIQNVRFVIRALNSRSLCSLRTSPFKVQLGVNLVAAYVKGLMATKTVFDWNPQDIIDATKKPKTFACVVVNRRITIPVHVVETLWQNAEYRCTVDGGTNRWRDFLITHNKGKQLKHPDFITGDFDSITKETSEYFNNPATQRVHTPDQNFTDFTKAIHLLTPYLHEKEIKDIYVFHDTSGRLDHIMANINTLYKVAPDLNIYLMGGNSIAWLLKAGVHTIHIPKDLVEKERWCALLPVGGPANVSSIGLMWDLHKDLLAFDSGIVSTSNSYKSDVVHIKTNVAILWSMGVFNFHDD